MLNISERLLHLLLQQPTNTHFSFLRPVDASSIWNPRDSALSKKNNKKKPDTYTICCTSERCSQPCVGPSLLRSEAMLLSGPSARLRKLHDSPLKQSPECADLPALSPATHNSSQLQFELIINKGLVTRAISSSEWK